MKKRKWNRTRLGLVVVTVFLLLLNVTLGLLLTRQANDAMLDLIHSRMLDVANTAAAMLDGDVLESLQVGEAGTERYQQVFDTLNYFQRNIKLKYIYTVRDDGDRHFSFIIDPSDEPGEFGSPVVYTDALYAASLGSPAVDAEPYRDAWGTFYSAYTPVFTSDGRVGGIVAVDFGAEWYEEHMHSLVFTVLSVALTSLAVGILIVSFYARRSRKRYQLLYSQLNELGGRVEELVQEVENGAAAPAREPAPEETLRDADADMLGEKILSLQDELRRHVELIREQAYHDGMTGVGNKTAYLDAVRELDRQIEGQSAAFAVGVFDLNALKSINDNYGHECGDRALIDAAGQLTRLFGADKLYRIGGDEFIALLPGVDEAALRRLFAELDAALAEINKSARPYVVELALSKGAAVYRPGEDADFKAVFKRADVAMYEDKRLYYTRHGDRRRQEP